MSPKDIKWKTLLGLLMIYSTVVFYPHYQWLWGVLFLYWTIPSLVSGISYFIEPIHRRDNPLLFWVITFTWLVLSAYILVEAI